MKSFHIKCGTVTNLFIGGALHQFELRTQSINGVLRWWFRVAGGSFDDEKRLFGWAGEKSNQGVVRIFIPHFDRLETKKFSKEFDNKGFPKPTGINYIGFALDQRFKKDQNKPQREYIKENQQFELIVRFHPLAKEDDIKKFFCALWLSFNLGNFGSRARRGFGSIAVEKVEENGKDITQNCFGLKFKPQGSLGNWIKRNLTIVKYCLNSGARKDIPYVFSGEGSKSENNTFEIYRVEKQNYGKWKDWVEDVQESRKGEYLKNQWNGRHINTWKNLLDFMGFLLMAFRSYREPDYQNAKDILQAKGHANNIFERPVFGLPLNFYFSSIRRGSMVHLKKENETLRRASPLIFKILKTPEGYEGLFIVAKSRFMPSGTRLEFSGKNVYLPNNQWKALDEFIGTLQTAGIIKKIWP